jgi:naphthoate synthase
MQPFNDTLWDVVDNSYTDITCHKAKDSGVIRVAINRPECRNAFRPQTVDELLHALARAQSDPNIGCVLLTGNGPCPKDGGWAFSSGGDQRVRGPGGYEYQGQDLGGRLHILEVQRAIRFMPKIVIAVVPGWAVGGGHSLHVVCDLTIASKEHAVFKQTDPDVASFDSGYGSAYLAKHIGQKRAREIFFLGLDYSAQEAFDMGMVNAVVTHMDIEIKALEWAQRINSKSPTAMRMLKYGFNLTDDGLVGQQLFAGEATRLMYGTKEAKEGRDAFVQKLHPV